MGLEIWGWAISCFRISLYFFSYYWGLLLRSACLNLLNGAWYRSLEILFSVQQHVINTNALVLPNKEQISCLVSNHLGRQRRPCPGSPHDFEFSDLSNDSIFHNLYKDIKKILPFLLLEHWFKSDKSTLNVPWPHNWESQIPGFWIIPKAFIRFEMALWVTPYSQTGAFCVWKRVLSSNVCSSTPLKVFGSPLRDQLSKWKLQCWKRQNQSCHASHLE